MLHKIKNKIHEWNATQELRKYAPLLAKDSDGLDAEQLVELIYSSKWERFFWIKQLKEEIKELVKIVAKTKPKIVVEIGTNMGGTLFCFTKVAHPEALIISIDLPGGPGGGGYPLYRTKFYQSFACYNQKIILWRLNSHDTNSLERLNEVLNDRKIDFLFIDGDHTYEGIKQDFEWYSPLVRSGGIIAFHDIKPTTPDNWIQVDKFWNEIKRNYKYLEIISNEETWGGIGVLYQN
jgi:predicted O-methyltransferase YrrM